MITRRTFLRVGAAAAAAALVPPAGRATAAEAGDRRVLALPKPDMDGGKPLMACLRDRRTNRALGHEDVDLPVLGDLLWAAWGVNREDGKHVTPTGMNRQEVLVYAVRGDGVWEYLPGEHAIRRVLDGDRRGAFDGAGLVLLYAAPEKERFAAMHVGSMYQNVGLYCASAGLANCVKYQRHDALDDRLPLPGGWKVYITQSVAKPHR
ncbi:MAG: nitroreductase family protein [Desulfovibrio sp.]|nr:nitroreductase family protein [Desulfovibrio sp.]